jgi:hypothetical protein
MRFRFDTQFSPLPPTGIVPCCEASAKFVSLSISHPGQGRSGRGQDVLQGAGAGRGLFERRRRHMSSTIGGGQAWQELCGNVRLPPGLQGGGADPNMKKSRPVCG